MTLLDRLNTAQKHPGWEVQSGISESLNTLKKETPKIAENNPKSHPKEDALTHPKQDALITSQWNPGYGHPGTQF